MKTKNPEIYKSKPYYAPTTFPLLSNCQCSRVAVERLPGQSTWGPKRHGKPGGWWGGGGERMENEYVVPWDRGVDRFLGGEDVMVYTVVSGA